MNKILKLIVLPLLCGLLASCSDTGSEGQPPSSAVPKNSPSAAASDAASAGGQQQPTVTASASVSAPPAGLASPDAAAAKQAPSVGKTDHSAGGSPGRNTAEGSSGRDTAEEEPAKSASAAAAQKPTEPRGTDSITAAESGAGGRKTQAPSRARGSQTLEDVIPEDWTELRGYDGEPVRVAGDLNKDGIKDAATVIEKAAPAGEEAPERALLIAFGKPDGSYKLSVIADGVLLRADEGGVWGDPFDGLEINRGSLVVSEYGGSNWRWYNRYRFRYQDGDWFLIGMTSGTYFNGGEEPEEQATEEDYNLLTGDYIIKGQDENGKAYVEKGNRGKKPLVKLRDFDLSEM